VALATANYTISNWNATACTYEANKVILPSGLLVLVISLVLVPFSALSFKLFTMMFDFVVDNTLEELWLTPAEELHEEVRRRYIKRSKGKRKTNLEHRYSVYSWRYNSVTFEMDEDSQTKIVTLKEDMRRIPGNDKEWKRKHGSRAREVAIHTHPVPPAASPPLAALRSALFRGPAAPIAIPVQNAAPAPVFDPNPSPPMRASRPAPQIDPHNQLLADLFGDLNRISDRRRRRRESSSWETVRTNTNEESAEPTPMATNSERPTQDEELSVPPPFYHSHGFAD
jgi:hypothetical protein